MQSIKIFVNFAGFHVYMQTFYYFLNIYVGILILSQKK